VARGRARAVSQDFRTNGSARSSRFGAEIYLRTSEDVLRVGSASSSQSDSENRHHQSQSPLARRTGLYRLPAARSRQDYRGAVFGTPDAGRARLRADDVEGTEAHARSGGL